MISEIKMNILFSLTLLALIGFTVCEVCNDINEEFTECGSACPLTCEHPVQKNGCIEICMRGCICKAPHIRDETTGKCVLPTKCTKQCADPNEVYTNCGSACPVTCANMNQTNRACIDLCVSGCFCKSPLVRNNSGKCVLKSKCTPVPKEATCNDPNETYNQCGTACPLTCKNFADPPKMCILVCREGCFCNSPYVRDETTGKCVQTLECPAVIN